MDAGASPTDTEASLRIQEEFESIQGEGALAGTPSHFIRTSGCNLRCTWCDSPATSWSPVGERRSVDTIVRAALPGPAHVVVTGGEPMLAPIAALTAALRASGKHVTIETAATVDRPRVEADLWSLSPKLAHSVPHERAPALAARHDAARWNPGVVRALIERGRRIAGASGWQLKFVVRARQRAELERDVDEIETMLTELAIDGAERTRVFLMPECIEPERLRDAYRRLAPIVASRGFRLGLRLHLELFGHTPGT